MIYDYRQREADALERETEALRQANTWDAHMAMERRDKERERRKTWWWLAVSLIPWGAVFYMLFKHL